MTKNDFVKKLAEVNQENKALKETIVKLLEELDKSRAIDTSNVIRLELTPEQRILETQIHRLEAVSRERQLTLEETRALDLHIKNKRLLDDKSTINADYTKVPDGLTEADLMRIAGSAETEPKKLKKGRGKSKTSS